MRPAAIVEAMTHRAEAIYIHPDGSQVLAFANKQVWSIAGTRAGSLAPEVDLREVALCRLSA